MFCFLSKHMRKMTHGIIKSMWNIILFMPNLSIYLFKYSLHFFKNNGMIRKISKTKVWPGKPLCFITLTALNSITKCKTYSSE